MREKLTRGILLGAPFGHLVGIAVYGGIGYWIAGQAGLIVCSAIATAFAVAGLTLCLRFVHQQFPLDDEVPF